MRHPGRPPHSLAGELSTGSGIKIRFNATGCVPDFEHRKARLSFLGGHIGPSYASAINIERGDSAEALDMLWLCGNARLPFVR
jgi:hypothetical protein